MLNAKRILIAVLALSVVVASTAPVQAQHYGPYAGSSGYSGGYYQSGPVYHPPSVHYGRVYHAESSRWTPFRGLHTHGHYGTVQHYTPGHFDYGHGGHIDANPYYHHR